MAKITSLTYKVIYTTVNHPNQLMEHRTLGMYDSMNRKTTLVYAKNLVHNETINKVWLYHIHVVKKEEIR